MQVPPVKILFPINFSIDATSSPYLLLIRRLSFGAVHRIIILQQHQTVYHVDIDPHQPIYDLISRLYLKLVTVTRQKFVQLLSFTPCIRTALEPYFETT